MECFLLKRRVFLKNINAVSIMYDAVFFIVLVSLSGVVLLPALQSDVAIEGSIDKHREHVADEALNTLLVSRADVLSYKVGGDLIDDAAGIIGIDNSSNGLYNSILSWLLAREQLHKTYSNLISENLGCQIRLPFSFFGTNRFNIFTGDYDRQLKKEIESFLDYYLGDKYNYNFTAIWHPIKGISLGGSINIGPTAPDVNCYVSKCNIMMPYKPTVTVNGTRINFTRYWFEEEVLKKIPVVYNITNVVQDYNNGVHPYDTHSNATTSVNENLTSLVYGFLVDGIYDDKKELFPGIASAALDYGISNLKSALETFSEDLLNALMGESLINVDGFFGSISDVKNPIANAISDEINKTIQDITKDSFGSLSEGFIQLEDYIINEIKNSLDPVILPYIKSFIGFIFEEKDAVDLYDFVLTWLFDQISLNKAEVRLMVWEARG